MGGGPLDCHESTPFLEVCCSDPREFSLARWDLSVSMFIQYLLGVAPSQDSSEHQDDITLSSRGSRTKPSFTTVTGRGPHPKYINFNREPSILCRRGPILQFGKICSHIRDPNETNKGVPWKSTTFTEKLVLPLGMMINPKT